jgi:hypothetical protein
VHTLETFEVASVGESRVKQNEVKLPPPVVTPTEVAFPVSRNPAATRAASFSRKPIDGGGWKTGSPESEKMPFPEDGGPDGCVRPSPLADADDSLRLDRCGQHWTHRPLDSPNPGFWTHDGVASEMANSVTQVNASSVSSPRCSRKTVGVIASRGSLDQRGP